MEKLIHIHICPIKKLYLRVAEMNDHSSVVAVLCTTGNIDSSKLAHIQYLHVSFADVTDESRSDAFRMEQAIQIRAFLDNLKEASELYFAAIAVKAAVQLLLQLGCAILNKMR